MADENINDPGEGTSDPIKNLKGEFNRKMDSTQTAIKTLEAQNAELLKAVSSLTEAVKPAAARTVSTDTDDLETLYYKDPVGYAKAIEDRTSKRIMGEIAEANQSSNKVQQVLAGLANEFPELQHQDSELYKKAVENYNKLDKEDQKSPSAYKSAVIEAALELGVKPKSKRTDADEEFIGNSSSGPGVRRRDRKSDKLDPQTEAWADLLGLPNDAETKARLKTRSDRKWNQYQQPAPVKGKK